MSKRLISLVVLAALAAGSALSVPADGQQVPDPAGTGPTSAAPGPRQAPDIDLDALRAGGEAAGEPRPDGSVVVEVRHDGDDGGVGAAVRAVGGRVTGEVPGVLVEATVPAASVGELEASPLVDAVQPPVPVNEPTAAPPVASAAGGSTGEAITLTGADVWQDVAGFSGAGVRVGIIDNFGAGAWSAAETAGEVPAASGTFCLTVGTSCEVFAGDQSQGVAVAELIHEMAPAADLYLADVTTTADLQAAVDWFAENEVDVVSRAAISPYDGDGHGSGAVAAVVRDAIANGMAWFQAVGDNAGRAEVHPGSYHRWTFRDADGDRFVEFAPGVEVLQFWCGEQLGLRWDDFYAGAGRSDYDMFVFDPATWGASDIQPIDASIRNQIRGADPIERTDICVPGWNFLVVAQYSAGAGSQGDILEFGMDRTAVLPWNNRSSGAVPAADLGEAGVLPVGAIDPAEGATVASYSSRGPTNDLQGLAPAVVAPSCLTISVTAPLCFDGTAASTAVTAGAAALVLESGFAAGPRDLTRWLSQHATVDRGERGEDHTYGRGQLSLRAAYPDARIRAGRRGPFVGDGVYHPQAVGQGVYARGTGGETKRFTVVVENDGFTADRYRLQAAASVDRFVISYRVAGVARTRTIANGSFFTPELAPGESVTVDVSVTIRQRRFGQRYVYRRLHVYSEASPARGRDTVAFRVEDRRY